MNRVFICLGLMGLFFLFFACEKGEDEINISSHNSTESHKNGNNCMNCHKSGGRGEGWFTLAGTVSSSAGNSVYSITAVKLYKGPINEGNVAEIVEVDGNGNFYTTEAIDFADGLYVAIDGNQEVGMSSKITTGACNSCHGSTTDALNIN